MSNVWGWEKREPHEMTDQREQQGFIGHNRRGIAIAFPVLAEAAPHPAEAIGYLIEKNQDYIVLAPHVSGTQCNGEITIPRPLIHSMVELAPKPEVFVVEAPQHTDPAKLEEAKDE